MTTMTGGEVIVRMLKEEGVDKVFGIEGLKGVVLRTFGAGNGPTNEGFLDAIRRAVKEKNLAIVNITQCVEGMVEMGLYDASAGLLKLGVISGVDMTPESALVKMQFLLGMGYDIETVKRLMQKDLRGEQIADRLSDQFFARPAGEGAQALVGIQDHFFMGSQQDAIHG
jgi:hypothetical protein